MHQRGARASHWFGHLDEFELAQTGDEARQHQLSTLARVTAGCFAHASPRRTTS